MYASQNSPSLLLPSVCFSLLSLTSFPVLSLPTLIFLPPHFLSSPPCLSPLPLLFPLLSCLSSSVFLSHPLMSLCVSLSPFPPPSSSLVPCCHLIFPCSLFSSLSSPPFSMSVFSLSCFSPHSPNLKPVLSPTTVQPPTLSFQPKCLIHQAKTTERRTIRTDMIYWSNIANLYP